MKRQLPVLTPSPLPPLYAVWMDEFLAGPLPRETDATCDDCAMLGGGDEAESATVSFNPETKCCAYVPALPNYLVGRICADEDPAFAEGRATVEARVRAGVGVTPLGLDPPPVFAVLYVQSSASLFGRSRTLRCPHYLEEGGRCGIWAHRAAICATWYCKHVRGAVGYDFWTALHQLLAAAEQSLARWCVLELDPGAAALRRLFPPAGTAARGIDAGVLDGTPDAAAQRARWGRWAGRELDYYRDCASLVNALKWPEVLAIGGPELQIYARLVREAYERHRAAEIPAALKVGPFRIMRLGAVNSLVSSYSGYDPIELPQALLDVLPYFDGRPTNHALASISAERGVKLSRALLRKLIDFEILVLCE